MKPSAPAIALPVFTFAANTTAQKPFTLGPILRRFSPNSDVCAASVDFHGVYDWPILFFHGGNVYFPQTVDLTARLAREGCGN